jgi:hypothetical protein
VISWEQDVVLAKKPGRRRAQKPPFDGGRQADALSKLQDAAGLEATEAAQKVALSYPQYNRYLWGKLPLRTDQFKLFADAYGVTVAALTCALGLLDDAPDPTLRFSLDPEEFQRQVKDLEPELRDQAIRSMQESLAVMQSESDLARRN